MTRSTRPLLLRPYWTIISAAILFLSVLSNHVVSADDCSATADLDACQACTAAEAELDPDYQNYCEKTGGECKNDAVECTTKGGSFLPPWPTTNTTGTRIPGAERAGRGILLFLALIYLFLGLSLVAERFMAAIELITSTNRDINIQVKGTGEEATITVKVWNETVSNLTLMALGSSAPEILFSLIEIIGSNFKAGSLGPGTIVGSAAFNLFMIIALCVASIPAGEVRRIKHMMVFICTALWSIFAYIWLYLILQVISPDRVDVWEAILTFLFFPITVLTAYLCDKQVCYKTTHAARYYKSDTGKVLKATHGTVDTGDQIMLPEELAGLDPQVREFEEHRIQYINILRNLRKQDPGASPEKLEVMARSELFNQAPKSRAYYRIAASRKITGGASLKLKDDLSELDQVDAATGAVITRVFCDPGHYSVMENCGDMVVTIRREGGDLNCTITVDYTTEDGVAEAGKDYTEAKGTLTFLPQEKEKYIRIPIIDNDMFEEDEHFIVRLSNLRDMDREGRDVEKVKVELANPSFATILILDDDRAGCFQFDTPHYDVSETCGEVTITCVRHSGARGRISVPYKVISGTARSGEHFQGDDTGVLSFENEQFEAKFNIAIVDEDRYNKDIEFYVELDQPQWAYLQEIEQAEDIVGKEEATAKLGAPSLGDMKRLTIAIKEDEEFKGLVDKIHKKSLKEQQAIGSTSSWQQQFVEALTVGDSGDAECDKEDGAEASKPGCMDYVMHYLTLPWKLLFALIPPTEYGGGWVCFCVSIILIGLVTGVVGDVAGLFGCTVGLKDAVTAITFVALGTSVPDTFASKAAAVKDEFADSSIGNVNGSNAVNVFMGLGLAWTVASIYHAALGTCCGFAVAGGELGFSVGLFSGLAVCTYIVLIVRRSHKVAGGALGGSQPLKGISTGLFVSFWMIYVLCSALKTYCYF